MGLKAKGSFKDFDDLDLGEFPAPPSSSSSRKSTLSGADVDVDVDDEVIAAALTMELADLESMGHQTLKREKKRLDTQFDTIKRNQILKEAEDELADLLNP